MYVIIPPLCVSCWTTLSIYTPGGCKSHSHQLSTSWRTCAYVIPNRAEIVESDDSKKLFRLIHYMFICYKLDKGSYVGANTKIIVASVVCAIVQSTHFAWTAFIPEGGVVSHTERYAYWAYCSLQNIDILYSPWYLRCVKSWHPGFMVQKHPANRGNKRLQCAEIPSYSNLRREYRIQEQQQWDGNRLWLGI